MISVIIRTKNEEKWIRRSLAAVVMQDYPNFELILVDNNSIDSTVKIARDFPCKIVSISEEEFTYGRALNIGIEEARGDYIACLSAHCIPVNDRWLERLRLAFTSEDIAGVYGRQEPLPDSDPFDKRDLWITFGIESRVQKKDCFFHNANSMIRRKVWNEVPFCETISGVEDWDWSKKIINRGYSIVYEPSASVYHFHGIHQGRSKTRAERVVKVIELIEKQNSIPKRKIPSATEINKV